MDLLGRIVQLALTLYFLMKIFESVQKFRNPQIGLSLKKVRYVQGGTKMAYRPIPGSGYDLVRNVSNFLYS